MRKNPLGILAYLATISSPEQGRIKLIMAVVGQRWRKLALTRNIDDRLVKMHRDLRQRKLARGHWRLHTEAAMSLLAALRRAAPPGLRQQNANDWVIYSALGAGTGGR